MEAADFTTHSFSALTAQLTQLVHSFIMMLVHFVADSDIFSGNSLDDIAVFFHEKALEGIPHPMVMQGATADLVPIQEKELVVYNVINNIAFNIVVVGIAAATGAGVTASLWIGWGAIKTWVISMNY